MSKRFRRLVDKTAPRSDDDRTTATRVLRASLGNRDTFGKTHPINLMRAIQRRGGICL